MRYKLTLALLFFAAMLSTGCASIVHGGDREVQILSTPPGATFVVTNTDTKEVVATGTTPFTVRLRPGDDYFHGQNYKVALQNANAITAAMSTTTPVNTDASASPASPVTQANGDPVMIDINPKLSPWYFGNIVFGGLIGLFIVDPLTGAMWDLGPSTINHSFITGETTFKAPRQEKKKKSDEVVEEQASPTTQPSP